MYEARPHFPLAQTAATIYEHSATGINYFSLWIYRYRWRTHYKGGYLLSKFCIFVFFNWYKMFARITIELDLLSGFSFFCCFSFVYLFIDSFYIISSLAKQQFLFMCISDSSKATRFIDFPIAWTHSPRSLSFCWKR